MKIGSDDICALLGGIGGFTFMRRLNRAIRPTKHSLIGDVGVLFVEGVSFLIGAGVGLRVHETAKKAMKNVMKNMEEKDKKESDSKSESDINPDDECFVDKDGKQINFTEWVRTRKESDSGNGD